jgi:hypothetical protein
VVEAKWCVYVALHFTDAKRLNGIARVLRHASIDQIAILQSSIKLKEIQTRVLIAALFRCKERQSKFRDMQVQLNLATNEAAAFSLYRLYV